MTETPLLLVEDTPSLQLLYSAVLESAGYRVEVAANAAGGLAAFRRLRPEVVLVDLMLPDRDGLYLMREMLAERPATRTIVVTANARFEKVAEAIRAGAQDFLMKPFDEGRFIDCIRNALRAAPAARAALSQPASAAPGITGFGGASPIMRRVAAQIRAVSYTMAPVFITGEPGTGKARCARAIHDQSPRTDAAFIAVNCATIPGPQLEAALFGHVRGAYLGADRDKAGAMVDADGGTLFLENIESIDLALQAKLLHFLQTGIVTPVGSGKEQPVNIRLVCATTHSAEETMLVPDLLARLNMMAIHMPALRDRGADIIELAGLALRQESQKFGRSFTGLSPDLHPLLLARTWPGNQAELQQVIRLAVIAHDGPLLTPAMLLSSAEAMSPELTAATPDLMYLLQGLTLADIERLAIEAAIQRHDGSVPRAAKELGVAPSTLYRKREGWTG